MKNSAVSTNGTMKSTPTAWSDSTSRLPGIIIYPRLAPAPLADQAYVLLADRFQLSRAPLGGIARRHLVDDDLLHRLGEHRAAVHEAGERIDALEHLVCRAGRVLQRSPEVGVYRLRLGCVERMVLQLRRVCDVLVDWGHVRHQRVAVFHQPFLAGLLIGEGLLHLVNVRVVLRRDDPALKV